MKSKVTKVLEALENVIYSDKWHYVALYLIALYLLIVIILA